MNEGGIQTNGPKDKKIDDYAQPTDDRDRLYVSIKEGGRRLAKIEDCINASIR